MSTLEISLLGIGALWAMSVSLELLIIFLFIFATEMRKFLKKCEKEEARRKRRKEIERFHGEA